MSAPQMEKFSRAIAEAYREAFGNDSDAAITVVVQLPKPDGRFAMLSNMADAEAGRFLRHYLQVHNREERDVQGTFTVGPNH